MEPEMGTRILNILGVDAQHLNKSKQRHYPPHRQAIIADIGHRQFGVDWQATPIFLVLHRPLNADARGASDGASIGRGLTRQRRVEMVGRVPEQVSGHRLGLISWHSFQRDARLGEAREEPDDHLGPHIPKEGVVEDDLKLPILARVDLEH